MGFQDGKWVHGLHQHSCTKCAGTGYEHRGEDKVCTRCSGSGVEQCSSSGCSR